MSEIDVSKCMFFDKSIYAIEGKLNFCIVNHDNCYKFKDCYYKQLQQLKEHCKQVDETNKILYQEKCDLIKENEELKKLNEQLATYYPQENNELLKVKQCLDEIEEICKYDCEHECSNDSNNCGVCSCLEQRIQRKIKEVKGE